MSKTTQAKKLSKAKSALGGAEVEETKVDKTIVSTETQVKEEVAPKAAVDKKEAEKSASGGKKAAHSKKYLAVKKKIDSKKLYDLPEAIKLAKDTHLAKFVGKIEAHIMTTLTPGTVGEIVFPHLEQASKKIVVANDAVIAELKEGKVNFDILVSTPTVMTKLLPFARLLGPRGLMPNPKNGTLTDDTAGALKKLSVAKLVVKTEKSAPVIHMVVGKLDQAEKELVANLEELIKVINPTKIKKLVLSSTMGPGIKVKLN